MTARALLEVTNPIAGPWNAPNRLSLVTPDGSGDTIHPSVVDMGPSGWNGFRYWMGNTPYAAANNQLENPGIWASNNRIKWVVPPGVVNPLVPAPGQSVGFHSDTELNWDPDGSRMVLYYRRALFDASGNVTAPIELRVLTSTNGSTWTDLGKVDEVPAVGGRLSPAIVRTGVNQWRMWLWGGKDGTGTTRTATSPLGPWDAPVPLTLNGGSLDGWHGDVTQVGGKFYMAYSHNDLTDMLVATSTDGIAWTSPANPSVVHFSATRWDRSVYRPCLIYGPEPGYMSVWYSAISDPSPGGHAIGFTRIPLSAWG